MADPAGSKGLPEAAVFWTPSDDDLGEVALDNEGLEGDEQESGLGFFQGTWRIRDATAERAAEYLDLERRISSRVASLAGTAADYDRLIDVVESGCVGDPAERLFDHERDLLTDFAWDMPPDLGALEVGVAALTYALNAASIATAASCRGHANTVAWSQAPVVFFAADRQAAQRLEHQALQVGCTFLIDAARPELLVVYGRTVTHTMALAEMIISALR